MILTSGCCSATDARLAVARLAQCEYTHGLAPPPPPLVVPPARARARARARRSPPVTIPHDRHSRWAPRTTIRVDLSVGRTRYRGSIPSSLICVAAWRRPRGCCRTCAACSGGGRRPARTSSSSWRVSMPVARSTPGTRGPHSVKLGLSTGFWLSFRLMLPPLPARRPLSATVTSSRLTTLQ